MTTQNEYQVEIEQLDTRNKNEAELLDILDHLKSSNLSKTKRSELQTHAVYRYLQAVRRRNRIRRNWHPKQSYECDLSTLSFITKAKASAAITKELQSAVITYPDGTGAIPESCIDEIRNRIIEQLYANKKKRKKTSLESAVERILRNQQGATDTEIKMEMRQNPRDYGIVEIDDESVTFESESGTAGKGAIRLTRSLSTVKNIASRIRKKLG